MAELSTDARMVLATVYVHQAGHSKLCGEHARFGGLSEWMLAPITGLSWEDAAIALHELDRAGLAAPAKGDRYALTDDGVAFARSPVGVETAERFADRASARSEANEHGASNALLAYAPSTMSRVLGALSGHGRRGRPRHEEPDHR